MDSLEWEMGFYNFLEIYYFDLWIFLQSKGEWEVYIGWGEHEL